MTWLVFINSNGLLCRGRRGHLSLLDMNAPFIELFPARSNHTLLQIMADQIFML